MPKLGSAIASNRQAGCLCSRSRASGFRLMGGQMIQPQHDRLYISTYGASSMLG